MKTSKKKLTAQVLALTPEQKDKILQSIVVDCIFDGWKLDMTSNEILGEVVDVLRESGLPLAE